MKRVPSLVITATRGNERTVTITRLSEACANLGYMQDLKNKVASSGRGEIVYRMKFLPECSMGMQYTESIAG